MKSVLKFSQRLKLIPVLIIKLFVVQFFTWFALFALWIYSTPVITRYIFKTSDSASREFGTGIVWVGYCFAFYSFLAAILSFYLPALVKKIGILKVHAFALLIAAVGFLAIYFVHSKWILFIPFACIGIGWSSISNIPYKIVASSAEESHIDFYMSVFSFSVVIPQVFAATLLGFITSRFLGNNSLYTILCGGVSMLIAGGIMFFIRSPRSQNRQFAIGNRQPK
jgi:maltose/moltooligosaccharide transporter